MFEPAESAITGFQFRGAGSARAVAGIASPQVVVIMIVIMIMKTYGMLEDTCTLADGS